MCFLITCLTLIIVNKQKKDLQTERRFLQNIGLFYNQEVVLHRKRRSCKNNNIYSLSLNLFNRTTKRINQCFVSFFPPKRVFVIPTRRATGQHGF